LNDGRSQHAAILLPDGEVLVAGGIGTSFSPITGAEVYDPDFEVWIRINPMISSRYGHTATLLPNGNVLVIGGLNAQSSFAGAEIFNCPTGDALSGTWTATSSPAVGRISHAATGLSNGRVLLLGGWSGLVDSNNVALPTNRVEVYDWAVAAVGAHAAGHTPRENHQATLLPDGRVLVAGGQQGDPVIASVELCDPVTGAWTATNSLNSARVNFTLTLLPDGRVLATGGAGADGASTNSAELFDPSSGTWTFTGSMNSKRSQHAATLLANGQVLVVGGIDSSGTAGAGAELYDPGSGDWTSVGPMNVARAWPTATLLPNGKVLVAGGSAGAIRINSSELYDPAEQTWTISGTLNAARYLHSSTLLPNGKVLVAGGNGNSGVLASAELYNPATELWTTMPAMSSARYLHTATLLPQGKVLIAGGRDNSGNTLASTELFDPTINTWSSSTPLNVARQSHTATLMPNGGVLLQGGAGTGAVVLVSGELYEPGLNYSASWRPQIATLTPLLGPGGSLTLTGSQFRGIAEASGGNSTQDSATDYPVVQLRNIVTGQTVSLLATNWSVSSFNSAPVTGLPFGWTLATVFVNGIPSTSSTFLFAPVPSSIQLINAAMLPGGACQFDFTNTPGAFFSTLTTTNLSLPLNQWTLLGGVTEISSGQFQFTDLQATNYPQRFYRVRSP
jgi:WD40 repeat protein